VVSLCAVYVGIVLVQGGTKLALNIYRGWVGERAKRELRRRVHTFVETGAHARDELGFLLFAEEPFSFTEGQALSRSCKILSLRGRRARSMSLHQ